MIDVFGLLGTTISREVRVDEPVGEGGFAVVYGVLRLEFEQPVAVKCLKFPAHISQQQQTVFLDRFKEEGKRKPGTCTPVSGGSFVMGSNDGAQDQRPLVPLGRCQPNGRPNQRL